MVNSQAHLEIQNYTYLRIFFIDGLVQVFTASTLRYSNSYLLARYKLTLGLTSDQWPQTDQLTLKKECEESLKKCMCDVAVIINEVVFKDRIIYSHLILCLITIVGQNPTEHLTNSCSSVKSAKIDIKMVMISSYFDENLLCTFTEMLNKKLSFEFFKFIKS